nr:reverse transcriptase domain-containing protein [Tanacetum cinerariifolium]
MFGNVAMGLGYFDMDLLVETLVKEFSIMYSSAIPFSANSTEESVGSSASLIILSDSDSEAPPSLVHHDVADPESDPSKAEFEEDPSEDDPSKAAEPLSTQAIPPPESYKDTIARWRDAILSPSPVHASLSLVVADCLPPRKRLRGSPAVSLHEDKIKDTNKAPAKIAVVPTVPHVHAEPTRLEEIEEGQSALKDRAKTAETERANLHGRVRDYKAAVTAMTQRAPVLNQRIITCYECGRQGHIKSECIKLKNHNHGNQNGNNEACRRAYVLGVVEVNPDFNVITGMFLLNNRYASILFDSGIDRSFVSTTFSSLIDVVPIALEVVTPLS